MQLGWIDFSKTERNKILSVLDLLSESGTLDELGIAPIRDGFANLFFPGTSTIQTRAKYFFLVPYALKELELSNETNPNRFLRALNETEKMCGETLLEINPNENGIIGKRSLQSGKWVKRTPADIYWAGLRKYGIFTGGNISLSEYARASCAIKNQKSNLTKLGNRNDSAEENETDDKNAGNIFKMQFWKMPLYTKEWRENIHMDLTTEEGAFLREQIVSTCPDSMISYILENKMTEVLDLEYFSDLGAIIQKFPKQMQDEYTLALSFSDFLFVARTLYNIIISDGQNVQANDTFEELKEVMAELAEIDIDLIFAKLYIYKVDLKNFIKKLQDCMRNNDVEEMKKAIKAREIMLKGQSRAKTAHPGEFDPNDWIGGGELDYRFNNAKTIIRDIFESEGLIDAES
ncbi:MAG: hypothetical protein J6Q94_00100 [Clostridia bacterium]|nr:hypothetical protein [Clostridia bacterium]